MTNIEKIRQSMAELALPALLLTGDIARRYASGFNAEGAMLILPERAWFITDSRYIEAAAEAVRDAELVESTAAKSQTEILKELLKREGVGRVGVQEETLSYAAYLRLKKKLEVEFLPAEKLIVTLRQVKEPWEIQRITAAQRIAEKALETVLSRIREGVSEREIAAELEYQMAKNGAEGLAFETICVSGPNSSLPHGVPGDRKFRKGDFITMDFGCKKQGYCSDMTRTVALGEPDGDMKKVYETVLAAQETAIAAARAGMRGMELDAEGRRVIEAAGYGEYFGHSLGHSLGLYIHESPSAGPKEQRPLPAGAVITCEPGIYIPGRFGVRIEDMLLLREGGCENLTRAPKELTVL